MRRKTECLLYPDLAVTGDVTTSFLDFIPKETTLAMRDFLWLRERIQVVHDEALTPQAIAVQEAEENGDYFGGKLIDGSEFTIRALDFRRLEFGNKPTGTPNASITFSTSAQPIFHKNFDLVASSFKDYLEKDIRFTSVAIVQSKRSASRLFLRIVVIRYNLRLSSVLFMKDL